jgi:hypothetical protein
VSLLVIDASVAVRWLVQLPGHEEARALLGSQYRLVAPEFLPAEVGSALTKLVRAGVLTQADGVEAYGDFFRAPVRLLPIQPIAEQAMGLALKMGQSCYDSLYLALAEREGGLFATADGRFCAAIQGTAHGCFLRPVGTAKSG